MDDLSEIQKSGYGDPNGYGEVLLDMKQEMIELGIIDG